MALNTFDIAVLVPPSGLSVVVTRVIERLCALAGYRLTSLLPHEPPAAHVGQRSVHLVAFPGAPAIEAIRDGRVVPLVLVTDPTDTVEYTMRTEGRDALDALRRQTAAHVGHPVALCARVRAVLAFEPQTTAGSAVATIARYLGLDLSAAQYGDLLAALGIDGAAPIDAVVAASVPTHAEARAQSRVPPEFRGTAETVLTAMCGAFPHEGGLDFVWPTMTFLTPDTPGPVAPQTLPLLGPSRNMYYGPYFHLPPGSYDAVLSLTFGGRMEDIEFAVDVDTGAGDVLGRYMIEPRPSGAYRARFDFTVTDPATCVHMRLRNERGAIEGEVSFLDLRLRWHAT